ncbi:MAG: acyltransferase family protein [Lachnospira sp.]
MIVTHWALMIIISGGGWIFVEFFFMITGYFTYKHFYSNKSNSLDDIAKNSISYTLRKYLYLLPYIIVIELLKSLFDFITGGCIHVGLFTDMVLETLLLSKSAIIVIPIWYLLALFKIFPIFCCLCQMKSKHFLYVLSLLYIICFYNYSGVVHSNSFPFMLFRAMAGLLLGVLIFYIISLIQQINLSKIETLLLTIIEEISLLLVVVIAYYNKWYTRFSLLCLFVGLTLLLSNKTYTGKISLNVFNYLGKLSMPIFLLNYPLGNFLKYIGVNKKYSQLLLICSCILISMMLCFIIEKIRKCVYFDKLKNIEY